MEGKNVSILIAAFVMIILGVALIGTVASEILTTSEKTSVAGEVIDISVAREGGGSLNRTPIVVANAQSGWQSQDVCTIDSVSYGNATTTRNLIADTDYSFSSINGTLIVLDSAAMNNTAINTTYIDYLYCGDTYLPQGWQRTVLKLVPGFFALAILLIGIGLLYIVLKNEGILDKF